MNHSFLPGAENYIKDNVAVMPTGCVVKDSGKCFTVLFEELEIGETIGSGCSSIVLRSIHKPSNTLLALKSIKMYEKTKREQLIREINALCHSQCTSLITFYGAFFRNNTVTLALEYMDGGSLKNIIKQIGTITEKALAGITYQILNGLSYLESMNKVHRDIKPSNILINSSGQVKLSDFGIMAELKHSNAMCETFIGTFKYMSPERICKNSYGYASDIWSLGLVLIECSTGIYPYKNIPKGIEAIQNIIESPSPSLSEKYFSTEFCNFIKSTLRKKAIDRPSAHSLMTDPWIKLYGVQDLETARRNILEWMNNLN